MYNKNKIKLICISRCWSDKGFDMGCSHIDKAIVQKQGLLCQMSLGQKLTKLVLQLAILVDCDEM